MIIVTGATGALNGATVDHLLNRVPAEKVVVAVRDPARAERFAAQGVEVRRADYGDPGHGLEDVRAVVTKGGCASEP